MNKASETVLLGLEENLSPQADQTFTKSFFDEEMFDHDFNDISIMHENVS